MFHLKYISMTLVFISSFIFTIVGEEAGQNSVPQAVLKQIDADTLSKISVRLLDLRCNGSLFEVFLAPDGKKAAVVEPRSEEAFRLAVWDLDKGKLVRFLAAVEDVGTKPYAGDDSADFGIETIFISRAVRQMTFSPDGKLVAVLMKRPALEEGKNSEDEIRVWELASGKQVCMILPNTLHHAHTFFFVDPTHLVTKAFSQPGVSLELIDVATGKIDHLLKNVFYEMYGGSVHDGLTPFAAPSGQMFAFRWETKERINYDATPPGSSNYAADRTWYSGDGKTLYARKHGVLQSWDAHSLKFLREISLGADSFEHQRCVAEEAGLMALRRKGEKQIEFLDVQSGKIVTAVQVPFRRIELAGMSTDGKRLAIPTDDRKLLIVDFPSELPQAVVTLESKMAEARLQVLR